LIPAANLTKPRVVTPPKAYPVVRPAKPIGRGSNPFEHEPSVPIVKRASNPFEPEHSVTVPAYGKHREPEPPTDGTTLEAPSLRELVRREVASARPNNPFEQDKTTIARPPSRPENPFLDDGTTSTSNAEAGPTDEMPSLRKMADTSVDGHALRRAAPPVPRTPGRSATEFPLEPTSYGTVYETREVESVRRPPPPPPRPSPTSYSIVRPSRMPRGTAVPPPVPTRKPR
jgi:hypothetical protein